MTAPARAPRAPRARRSTDRERARPGGIAALVAATAAVMAATGFLIAPATSLAPPVAAALLAGVAALALLGLPSVSITSLATLTVLTSGLSLAVLGLRPATWAAAGAVGVWIVAVVATLVVAAHLGGPWRRPGARSPSPTTDAVGGRAAGADASPRVEPSGLGLAMRVAVISAVVVAVVGLVLPAADRLAPGSRSGDQPRLPGAEEAMPLVSSDSLDMTRRPRLSDRIVMRVRADHATFWRVDTFDVWDGRTWTRSEAGFRNVEEGRPIVADHDLGAAGPDVVRQTFTMVTPAAVALPGSPTVVDIDVPGLVFQREDGSMVVDPPLGGGARFTTESRRFPASDAALAADAVVDAPTPDDILDRYASDPTTTDRVRAAAAEATAGTTTRIEAVRAIEAWMAERTEYSIDAALAPTGVDVVDDFLFESRQGWCEQIASAFVVLARANAIPARLATGYVPGELDRLTGEFIVREREAHAWAEIWFPEVGWVPFDPTADVPPAGEDQVRDWTEWMATWWPRIVGAAVVLALVGALVVVGLRRRRRAGLAATGPAARLEAALDALGERVGRARGPTESASAFGAVLARRLGARELSDVGACIDRALYADPPPDDDELHRADAVLVAVAARPDP